MWKSVEKRKAYPFCNTEFIGSYFSKKNPNFSYKSFVEENEYDDPAGVYNLSIDSDDCVEFPHSMWEGRLRLRADSSNRHWTEKRG